MFKPLFTAGVIVLSVGAAIFEGAGLSFILPIIEFAQAENANPATAEGLLGLFVRMYQILGIPFTLGYLVSGVATVMVVRFTMSFLVGWLRGVIETSYIRHLQMEGFDHALDAQVAYFDTEGSDDILNAIVTQTEYAGRVIRRSIQLFEQVLLSAMYTCVALYIAPVLTILTATFLGSMTLFFRHVLEGGYSIGDRVADANERIQQAAQAGTQGIRDVKLFGMRPELFSRFQDSVDQYEASQIKLYRNDSAIQNFYQMSTAISVFVLIYAALMFTSLSVGELGVFLFAMFRLGPRVSNLNKMVYRIEGELPHLVRTQRFIEGLQQSTEPQTGSQQPPATIDTVSFDTVKFSYDSSDQTVLQDVSFSVDTGEFVGFVGPSGAGKSTIMSLLARLYEPDTGTISANDISIDQFDIDQWRSQISVVRQDPHIFNETLRRNVTIGNRDATTEEIEEVCEIAKVTEFLNDLPAGYETVLGDDGVKLSGGQRQRIAIARALLKDADILVLDEATSDLDTSLEEQVHRAIERLDRNYAMLVIAHRLSTVINADRIYTMDDGEIVERGTHDELLGNGGTYADLYNVQAQSQPLEQ